MKRFIPVAWRWLILGANLMVLAAGQEVSITPLAVIEPQAIDEPPRLTAGLLPKFPEEFRKIGEVGWVEIDFLVDEKGEVRKPRVWGTERTIEEAARKAFSAHGRLQPARRDGVAVKARARLTMVFDPAASSPAAADAAPRLLAATCTVDPDRAVLADSPTGTPEAIWARVSLDESGRVMAVAGIPRWLERVLHESFKRWRFAPARMEGRGISTEMSVPVLIVAPDRDPGEAWASPRVVLRPDLSFPFDLGSHRDYGSVSIDLRVGADGRVQDTFVARAPNRAIGRAAEARISQWRFEPARAKGVAVASNLRHEMRFSIDEVVQSSGRESGSGPSGAMAYDVAPKVQVLVPPIYPTALLEQRIEGSARVSLLIGADGEVLMSRILEADRPEFGYAIQAAAELGAYAPASKQGKPVVATIALNQAFDRRYGQVFSDREEDALRFVSRHPEQIVKPRELDEKPRPIYVRQPAYPRSLLAQAIAGKATVEVLILPDGKAALPRVTSSTAPEFGYAAVQAIAGWSFALPVAHGRPVAVRVQVPFEFPPPAAVAPASVK